MADIRTVRTYEKALAYLDAATGTPRSRLERAAEWVTMLVDAVIPPELLERQHALTHRLVTPPEYVPDGRIAAAITALSDAEVEAASAEIRAIGAALQVGEPTVEQPQV